MGNLVKETPYSEITATLELLDRHGVTREHLTRLRSDSAYAEAVMNKLLGLVPFTVTVNYDRSIEEMVLAGKYNWSNPDINARNFPTSGHGEAEATIELVHFDRDMESDEVLRELDKMGLRPATLPELLAFGATYPEKQREFPIVALGSVWRNRNGSRSVAYLYGDSSERRLNLSWLEDRWYRNYRFAAVRK